MTIINLPIDDTEVNLANDPDGLIWKQIIPLDKEIVYGGQKLKFSKDILDRLKTNFESGIAGQTAFQLADDQNKHDTDADKAANRNYDPQRFRGDIQKVTVDSRGFRIGMKPTDEGLALIKSNPKLGVSASIKPNYVDSSGKTHDFVLRHVVGTIDPKIKDTSPWELEGVNLTSTDDPNEEVYDLTTPTVSDPTNSDVTKSNAIQVDKTKWDEMQNRLAEFDKGEELLNKLLAEDDDEPTNLTNSGNEPKEDPRILALQNDVAKSRWEAQKANYIKDGVPAGMLNMCDDVMSVYDAPVINLSNGSSADPRETIHKLLGECKGQVDLSGEFGHGLTVDEREAEQKAANEWVSGFMNQYTNDVF